MSRKSDSTESSLPNVSSIDAFGFDKSDESDPDEDLPVPSSSRKPFPVTPRPPHMNPSKHNLDVSDEYDFDNHLKKAKVELLPQLRINRSKPKQIVNAKDRAKVYTHKWGSDDEEDPLPLKALEKKPATQALKFKKVGTSEALKEFEDDFEYYMETLENPDISFNLKVLSLSKLIKRCSQYEFRQFLRLKQGFVDKLVKMIRDWMHEPAVTLIISTFFYMFARDKAQFPYTRSVLNLLQEMLKVDKAGTGTEFQKYKTEVWETISAWKVECDRRKQKEVSFDLQEEFLTVSGMTLVTFDYVVAKSPTGNKALQAALLDLGILQTIIAKVDKKVLELKLTTNLKESQLKNVLSDIEHAYRIIENGIMLEKKNQAFIVGHRNGNILFSSEKFLDFFCQEVKTRDKDSALAKQLFNVLCLVYRALMNASHGNEICAVKIGQIGNFILNSLSVLCNLHNYVDKDRALDLKLLICGLLINISEKCPGNRKKISNMKVTVLTPSRHEKVAVEALSQIFVEYESKSRFGDEELDNELMEEIPDDLQQEEGEEEDDLERVKAALQDDNMVSVLNSAMSKATVHMHDSMMASYLALLIGCLINTNEDLAKTVRQFLPEKNFTSMIEQLERFEEFAKLTKVVDTKCIETVITLLKLVNV